MGRDKTFKGRQKQVGKELKKNLTLAHALRDAQKNIIRDGDKVRLKTDQIMGRRDYAEMQSGYRAFVEVSAGKEFIAHPLRPASDGFSARIELEGADWVFWYGDLERITVTEEGGTDTS